MGIAVATWSALVLPLTTARAIRDVFVLNLLTLASILKYLAQAIDPSLCNEVEYRRRNPRADRVLQWSDPDSMGVSYSLAPERFNYSRSRASVSGVPLIHSQMLSETLDALATSRESSVQHLATAHKRMLRIVTTERKRVERLLHKTGDSEISAPLDPSKLEVLGVLTEEIGRLYDTLRTHAHGQQRVILSTRRTADETGAKFVRSYLSRPEAWEYNASGSDTGSACPGELYDMDTIMTAVEKVIRERDESIFALMDTVLGYSAAMQDVSLDTACQWMTAASRTLATKETRAVVDPTGLRATLWMVLFAIPVIWARRVAFGQFWEDLHVEQSYGVMCGIALTILFFRSSWLSWARGVGNAFFAGMAGGWVSFLFFLVLAL